MNELRKKNNNLKEIGVVGLGVMGANLARNLVKNGVRVVVYNRTFERTEEFLKEFGAENLEGVKEIEEMINKLARPRKILLMVQAGIAVDALIEKLLNVLEVGDIIVDGGNSLFSETKNRAEKLREKGILFVGMGVSGGEEGALNGPSLMPGGVNEAKDELMPILEKIAAKDFNGGACVSWFGGDGAGHFVKMVHNGIEYGMMQVLAEIYDLLKACGKSDDEIAEKFEVCMNSESRGFLLEIAIKILRIKENGESLVEKILDKAGQKGTGGWTMVEAAKLGVNAGVLGAGVNARICSTWKEKRLENAKKFGEMKRKSEIDFFDDEVEAMIWVGFLICLEQGMILISEGAKFYGFEIQRNEVMRIWQGGCIIRVEMLRKLTGIKSTSLFLSEDEGVENELTEKVFKVEKFLNKGFELKRPISALMEVRNYILAMRSAKLPANFIQGLRDLFGAHGFEKIGMDGVFHLK